MFLLEAHMFSLPVESFLKQEFICLAPIICGFQPYHLSQNCWLRISACFILRTQNS